MSYLARFMLWCIRFEQAIGQGMSPKYLLELRNIELHWEARLHRYQMQKLR
jgi:hypothetical protein